jgi:hypothetical protein
MFRLVGAVGFLGTLDRTAAGVGAGESALLTNKQCVRLQLQAVRMQKRQGHLVFVWRCLFVWRCHGMYWLFSNASHAWGHSQTPRPTRFRC